MRTFKHTGGEPFIFILALRNVPDFVTKDKARNASSVPGFVPQDAAKVKIKN